MSRYVYQRTGGPLLQWGSGAPPRQYQAAEVRSLGAWAPTRPGAPEMIGCAPCSVFGDVEPNAAAQSGMREALGTILVAAPVGAAAGYYLGKSTTAAVIGGVAGTFLRPWAAGAVVGYMAGKSLKSTAIGFGLGVIFDAVF